MNALICEVRRHAAFAIPSKADSAFDKEGVTASTWVVSLRNAGGASRHKLPHPSLPAEGWPSRRSGPGTLNIAD
jgi:hypothetical protein